MDLGLPCFFPQQGPELNENLDPCTKLAILGPIDSIGSNEPYLLRTTRLFILSPGSEMKWQFLEGKQQQEDLGFILDLWSSLNYLTAQ